MATVKEINHDSSTTLADHYTDLVTDTDGAVTVTTGAALNSTTNGVSTDMDAGAATIFLGELFSTTTPAGVRYRIRLDLDGLTNSNNSSDFLTFIEISGGGLPPSADTRIGFSIDGDGSTGFTVTAYIRQDTEPTLRAITTAKAMPSSDTCLEIRAVRETADGNDDGIAEFFINGVSQGSITDVQNFNSFNFDVALVETDSSSADLTGTFKYDEWLLTDVPGTSLCATSNAFRFLGFATDNENIYISGLKDAATLQLFDYDLTTLTESGTASFGSGTEAEIDAGTRGIFPVARPASDQILYLRGRDGNNVQVQYNNMNGTVGWTDIGPGTGTWATDKYAIGLMPAQTSPNDVIVAFSDDDVYRTILGTTSWAKQGDMPSGVARAAVRHPTSLQEFVAAGTAAGTAHYSQNLGVSYGDASGTALGTINAFEYNL